MTRVTRRRLLGALSLSTGAGGLSVAVREFGPFASDAGADSDGPAVAFDPAVDGFGFDNYATPPDSPDPTAFVSRGELRDRLREAADSSILDQLGLSLDGVLRTQARAIVDRLQSNADRLFGTNGYCYGMAAAAQWYAEEPAAIPVDRDSAGEIPHIDDPVDEPPSPVRDDVERFQRAQFTDPDSWVRRWPLLRPERIDYRAQARALRDAIDEFGSAGVTITGENVLEGHYVLCYGYEESDSAVTFAVYDPNLAAAEYADAAERRSRTIGVDTVSGEPLLEPCGEEYDRFLFVRADRDTNERVRPERDP